MSTYLTTVPAGRTREYVPKHPERTAYRDSGTWDVRFEQWPNRDAMARAIRKHQQHCGIRCSQCWTPIVPLDVTEGYR